MNRCFGVYLVVLIGLMCCRTMGEATPVAADPGISDTSKTDLNLASNSGEIEEIKQKVTGEVAKLAQNPSDPAMVSMVRQWLIDEMQLQGNAGGTSPAYQEAYANALNAAFMDVLRSPSAPVNTRLNIGVVIRSLPGSKSAKLEPSVVRLLKDKSPAVVLWGEKAAGAILPFGVQDPAFNAGPRDEILAAIIDSVAAHPDGPISGILAEDANQAINPKLYTWPINLVPTGAVLSALIDANLNLQKARLKIYENSGVPDGPLADTYASYLTLGNPDVWNAMTSDQQLQAAQQASNFVSLASQRAATRHQNENDELIGALQEEGRWIQELGTTLNDNSLQAAGIGVNKLGVAASSDAIRDACTAVYAAFQQNPTFSNLPAPPTIANPKSASDNSGSAAATEAQQ